MAVKGEGVSCLYDLLESGLVEPRALVDCLVKYMSDAEIWDCLDSNELTPRFWPEDE